MNKGNYNISLTLYSLKCFLLCSKSSKNQTQTFCWTFRTIGKRFYHRDTFTINSQTICHSNHLIICGLDSVIVIWMFNFYYFVCFCVSLLLSPITFFFHFVANYFQLHLCRSFFICRSCKSNSLR